MPTLSCFCCPKLFYRLWILAIHWWWRCAIHRWTHARTYYIKCTYWSQKPITQNLNPSSLSKTLLPHHNTWALLSEHIHSQHRGHYISDCLLRPQAFDCFLFFCGCATLSVFMFLHACLDDASYQGKFIRPCFICALVWLSVFLQCICIRVW